MHRERGQHRALRVILVGIGRAEESDEAIAAELVHTTTESVHLVGEQLKHAIHQLHPGFRAQLLHQIG